MITELINETPTSLFGVSYALIVKECYKRRRTLTLAQDLARATVSHSPDGKESSEVRRLIEEMQALLNDPYNPDGIDGLRQYLVHARDLANLPEIAWLIPGEIPDRGLTVVYGPSGVGKSFFVLDYALRVAQTQDVLYVAAEGESGFKMRVAAWNKHFHMDVGNLHFYLNVAALLDETERKLFTDQIVDFVKPKLIILDTVAHCMLPGDENSARDMGLFLRAAKTLQKVYDCAVLLVHHTNKEGNVERGSGALRGASDSMIKLSGDDDLITVECSKSKDSKPFDTRYIKLLPVHIGQDANGNELYSPIVIAAEKVERTKDDPLTNRQRLILEHIVDYFEHGAQTNELAEVTKIPRGSLIRSMGELRKLGFVLQEDKGDPYKVTSDGLAAIGRSQESQNHKNHAQDSNEKPHDKSQDSKNHKNHDLSGNQNDDSVSQAIHVSLEPQTSYWAVVKGLCPMCNKPLHQNGKGLKCPDCGGVYKPK
jgi:hypothetical protein